MFTFRQLEAIYWIDREGSFAAAAARLHTSQAAISKRIRELENCIGEELFDRSQRQARFTEKGIQLLQAAQTLLRDREVILESLANPAAMIRRIRIGITELVSMTWLPALLAGVRARYPHITIEPDVDSASRLLSKLQSDLLDLVIAPDAFAHEGLAVKKLRPAEFAWMCKPGTVPAGRVLSASELSRHTLLTQSDHSALGVIVGRWLEKNLVTKTNPPVLTNSLLPLIGLTAAGMGISYMPKACLTPMIKAQKLQLIRTSEPLPAVQYVVIYKPGRKSILVSDITLLAQETCDFSRMFTS
ncbi:LysR family transcriptional regulator [Diaphorobacter ruginosibacter]|uniref:LysR family transcriptional regulator n=1 Tax=Diaphorobacter ruginosibacter TaxID=1715720 RepID=UPI00333E8BAC